jgi:iron complex outermembrane receptor protein
MSLLRTRLSGRSATNTTTTTTTRAHRIAAFAFIAALGSLAALLPSSAFGMDLEKRVDFDIPAQDLSAALIQFSQQARVQVIVSEDLTGQTTQGVSGPQAIKQALHSLLGPAGLQYRIAGDTSITVGKPGAKTTALEQKSLRLAQAEPDGARPSQAPTSADAPPSPYDQSDVPLQELVVTAQKRAQQIKDVPISMSTLGASELEALRVEHVQDYIYSIPNATYIDSGAYYGQNVTLRGISDFSGGLFDVISVLVDDVGFSAVNSNVILSTGLFDLERIEVLRGPQGTLTGRNALGGSINIITAKPSTAGFDGSATLDLGRFGTQFARAALNVPLSESVAVRASAFLSRSDGMIRNVGPAGGRSGYDNAGGRIAARFQPGDALTIDAAFSVEKRDRDYEDWITHNFNPGDVDILNPNWAGEKLPILESWGGTYPGPIDLFNDEGNNGGVVSKDVAEFTELEDWTASFRAAYDFGGHRMDLIYGHFDYELDHAEDYDTTEYAWWMGSHQRETKTDSAELRVSSDYSGPVNWVAGVSYLDESLKLGVTDSIGLWAIEGGTPRLAGDYRAAYIYNGITELRSSGIFANVFWDITPRTHLSAGVRYSRESADVGESFVYDPSNPDLAAPPIAPGDFRANPTLEEVSPRIALNYDVTDAASVYFQFATGYRAGYGNTPLAISASAPEAVDPERLENYEIGIKGSVLEGRLGFAAAAFYMDYQDLQIQAPIPPALNPFPFTIFYDTNAGKAHTTGFELEAQLRLTEGLRLETSIGYTDAKIDELTLVDAFTLQSTDYSDLAIPNVRPWTAALAAIYLRRIGDYRATFRADYRFQDDAQWQQILPDPNYYLPSFQTVDLSAGMSRGPWDVTAYVENALDENYYTSVGWICCGYRGRLVHTPPRMFGVRATYSFDR